MSRFYSASEINGNAEWLIDGETVVLVRHAAGTPVSPFEYTIMTDVILERSEGSGGQRLRVRRHPVHATRQMLRDWRPRGMTSKAG